MENKPQIPTLKESRKDDKKGAPPLRIKGLQSGMSLVERLKQFKKKDLAFILSGLGVLFMAPLAEHFMMNPGDQGNGTMSEGWNTPGKGGSVFGNGSSPYEPGISGLAPGGTVGNGSDVITPLNVRDPSALVMGPGQTQQAPAVASQPQAAPPPPPSTKDDSKWNDAIAAGKAAASAATKKAALPVPHVPLSAGGLRGLGAVSGGSGSSFSLPAIKSDGLVSGNVNQSHGLTGTNGSGIKGVARGPNTGGTGNLEKLKAGASNAGGAFNQAGSAQTALEQAASRDMEGGSSGGGAGEGGGHEDKATAGSQNKDSKSPGESLEFLRQKMQMEKDIAYADELRKSQPCSVGGLMGANLGPLGSGGPNLECNKLKGEIFKSMITDGLVKPFTSVMASTIKGWLDPGAGKVFCYSKSDPSKWTQSMDKPGNCGATGEHDGTQGYCFSGGFLTYNGGPINGLTDVVCQGGTGDGSSPTQNTQPGADGTPQGPVTNGPPDKGGKLGAMCTSLAGLAKQGSTVSGTGSVGATVQVDGKLILGYQDLVQASQELASVKGWASGDLSDQGACGGTGMRPKGLATADAAVKPRLEKNKAAIRKMIAGYKRDVIGADGSRLQQLQTMEGQANNALNQKLNTAAKDPSEVDALYAAAEQPFAQAQKTGEDEKTADQQKWQPLAQKVPVKNSQDDLADIKKLMQEVSAGAENVKNLVTKARGEVATSDADSKAAVEKFAGVIEKSAAYWQQTVQDKDGLFGSGGAYYDQYLNQAKALSQFGAALDKELKTQHADAFAAIGIQAANGGAAPKDITGIGTGPVQTTPAAAGGKDYRGQIAAAMSEYKTQVAAAKTADEAQAGSGETIRTTALTKAKEAVTQADASINKSRQAYNEAASDASKQISGDIETLLGGPIQPAEADGPVTPQTNPNVATTH